jgi:hypothetical protein
MRLGQKGRLPKPRILELKQQIRETFAVVPTDFLSKVSVPFKEQNCVQNVVAYVQIWYNMTMYGNTEHNFTKKI